jgi:hypothetical protein
MPADRLRERSVRFAVIGDFGSAGSGVAGVSALVQSFAPDFVLTVGDNNYPDGLATTIDANVGQYYHEYIGDYAGTYGRGAAQNRFFPSIGNHDFAPEFGYQPYLDYFTLPGNERYYSFVRGPVHFFALNSDANEPDGVDAASVQASWLEEALSASQAPFQIVYYHHTQWTSGQNGNTAYMDWPFREWGADVLLTGHDHHYERFFRDDVPLFVDGIGGHSLRPIGTLQPGSQMQFNGDYGALLCEADAELATFQLVTRASVVIDMYAITPDGLVEPEEVLIASGDPWKYQDDGSDQGTAWRAIAFDDDAWAEGPSQLGYGEGDEATVVSFAPNPAQKYITTWLRRTIHVDDPDDFGTLFLRLIRDDGAVIYVNGTEVWRPNMPAGPIHYLTLAGNTGGLDETTWFEREISPALLVPGDNVVAVEVHQWSPTTDDMSLDLELVGTLGERLVPLGSTWKYLDDGTQAATGWTTVGFDDSGWDEGPAQLGYGEGDEATVVSFGPNPADKHITTYFRHAFDVADAAAFKGLVLGVVRDDGASVHLNGRLVWRNNLPLGELDEDTVAAFTVDPPAESAVIETSIDPRLLRTGTNVLAVEVHQWSPTTDDMSFDLSLYAIE